MLGTHKKLLTFSHNHFVKLSCSIDGLFAAPHLKRMPLRQASAPGAHDLPGDPDFIAQPEDCGYMLLVVRGYGIRQSMEQDAVLSQRLPMVADIERAWRSQTAVVLL